MRNSIYAVWNAHLCENIQEYLEPCSSERMCQDQNKRRGSHLTKVQVEETGRGLIFLRHIQRRQNERESAERSAGREENRRGWLKM